MDVHSLTLPIFFLAFVVLWSCGLYKSYLSQKKGRLPPGPPRLPIIGNAHQWPLVRPWHRFRELGKIYGDLMHFDVFGQSFFVVNSAEIAHELLDKRSSINSDRPHLVMAGELIGFDQSFGVRGADDFWKQQRRLMAHDFSPNLVPKYYELQEDAARKVVRNILQESSSYVAQLHWAIGSIIIRITYGYNLKSLNDPMLTTPVQSMVNFNQATKPGNFLVDLVPALKYMPSWLPGAGFQKVAQRWRRTLLDTAYLPYRWSKENLDTGKASLPNFCASFLQESGEKMTKADEEVLIWSAASAMTGGLDTNISTSMSFLMAMILHPEVQRKAQAEIDAVVGRDRLPTIADRPNLPYIRSLLTEIFRWAPTVPMGVPHVSTEDDVYNGMQIPKGSLIMPNIWHMLYNPEVYPDPTEFRPERYNNQDSEMEKVTDLLFGFGRRRCPGVYFARGTLFAIVSTFLATCNILPALDGEGNEILPTYEFTSGVISFPESFPIQVRPRFADSATLLEDAFSFTE